MKGAGIPTVTAALRRLALAEVTVQTLKGNLCSGLSGGAAPDALAALTRLLASLHDDTGAPAVHGPGSTGEWRGLQYPERDFRADAKVLPGVGLVGTGTAADRVWARPAVTVLGIDCPPAAGATPAPPPILGGMRSPLNWRLIPRPRGRAPTRAAFRHEPRPPDNRAPIARICGASSPTRNQPENRLRWAAHKGNGK